jgi:hypothetical protein
MKVIDSGGKPVAGKIGVGADGRSWIFEPAQAWVAQDYKVVVDERLEDTAGNTPVRAFDMDADAPPLRAQKLWLAFQPHN